MPHLPLPHIIPQIRANRSNRYITLGARDASLPKARISAQGDFWIGERAVSVTSEQRVLLQQFYRQSMNIARQSIVVAFKGMTLVFTTLFHVIQTIRGKKSHQTIQDDIESRVNADILPGVDQIIGVHLRQLKDIQDNLSAIMPTFRPYAGITEEDLQRNYRSGYNNGRNGDGNIKTSVTIDQ